SHKYKVSDFRSSRKSCEIKDLHVTTGGIAQLVERQLCKLEVRGSNPLASSLRSRRRKERRLSRRSLGEGGYLFGLLHFSRELRLGKPVMKQFFFVYVLQSELDTQRLYTGLTNDLRASEKSQLWPHRSHVQMEAVASQKVHRSLVIVTEPLGLSDISN